MYLGMWVHPLRAWIATNLSVLARTVTASTKVIGWSVGRICWGPDFCWWMVYSYSWAGNLGLNSCTDLLTLVAAPSQDTQDLGRGIFLFPRVLRVRFESGFGAFDYLRLHNRPYTIDLDQAQQYGQHVLMSVFFHAVVVSKVGFVSQILTFSKRSSRSSTRVSNSVDPDQDWHYDKSVIFVSPGLSPKCLQRYQQTTWKEFTMLSVKTKVRPIRWHFHEF